MAQLSSLPDSCAASADCLEKQRAYYERDGIFSSAMIDSIIAHLRSFDDSTLREQVARYPNEVQKLVDTYFHCG